MVIPPGNYELSLDAISRPLLNTIITYLSNIHLVGVNVLFLTQPSSKSGFLFKKYSRSSRSDNRAVIRPQNGPSVMLLQNHFCAGTFPAFQFTSSPTREEELFLW